MRRACPWSLWVVLVGGCRDEQATCADGPHPVVATGAEGTRLRTGWSGVHVHVLVDGDSTPAAVYVGPRCDAAPLVSRGATLVPARMHIDPADDDPTLTCDASSHHFFRIDLRGETPPTLAYPGLDCVDTTATAHGLLTRDYQASSQVLRLYSDFPDETSATLLASDVNQVHVDGDTLVFSSRRELFHRDLATGEQVRIPTDRLSGWLATATHVLWRGAEHERKPAPWLLVELASGAQLPIGIEDPAIDDPDDAVLFARQPWQFDPSARYVLHMPNSDVFASEAFDLRGAPVPFPVPGRIVVLLADGSAVSVDAAGQLFHTRIGAAAATAIDLRYPVPLAIDTRADDLVRVSPLFADHVEFMRDDVLWAAPLDGGAATPVARDVAGDVAWVDEAHVLTLFAGQLVTIRVADGERSVHARDVVAFTSPGTLAVDGAHYLARGGVVWLPPAVLVADGG